MNCLKINVFIVFFICNEGTLTFRLHLKKNGFARGPSPLAIVPLPVVAIIIIVVAVAFTVRLSPVLLIIPIVGGIITRIVIRIIVRGCLSR